MKPMYITSFHIRMIRLSLRSHPLIPGMPTPIQLAPTLFLNTNRN